MRHRSNYSRPAIAALIALAPLCVLAQGQGGTVTAPDVQSSKPTPRTADGHPDLSGYWKGTRDTKPVGNIAKDLPGLKLPLTPAGEATWKHNATATIDPESLCIIGGIPRHNASGLAFEVLQGANKVAFLYWYSYYRLIPVDANRKHSEDPDPSFFGEELGHWDKDALVVDSVGFKDTQECGPMKTAVRTVMRCTSWNTGRAPATTTFTLWICDPLRRYPAGNDFRAKTLPVDGIRRSWPVLEEPYPGRNLSPPKVVGGSQEGCTRLREAHQGGSRAATHLRRDSLASTTG